MPDFDMRALRETARLAYRGFDQLTETEKDFVLRALVDVGTDAESEVAAKTLFHRSEGQRLQLTLHALLDGIGHAERGGKTE